MDIDPPFDATALGLKEIGNLASWTVSSCKPGCGVEALRDEDPHHLNIHFSRLVSIRSIRIYLDFETDESYTPTKISLLAGTGYHDLIPFSMLEFTQPKGWIDVPLEDVGGGKDGKTLRAFLVQVKIMENHQNGKDTHVRGLKIYARDERVGRGVTDILGIEEARKSKAIVRQSEKLERGCLMEPDWMGEPELR
ncbi:Cyclosome subunit 10 [Hyphodiscus hymeniophilus]|uniref:Cyclosome subunit 10 n=1 Tax=Hyphodiscus hymeniophilus TaxID=353542 RepID=A0A9P6VJW8_9HELO|nr:Cyclosome subunit 10 [Hyphodiscus hymeniophilus]